MKTDSFIQVTPGLEIVVHTPGGETTVRLTRLSAQVLGAALHAVSGLPSKGVALNAITFNRVGAELVSKPPMALPVVRLGNKARGPVRVR